VAFDLPDDLQLFKQTVDRFVERECRPAEERMLKEDPDWTVLPDDLHRSLVAKIEAAGLWGLGVPAELDGPGLGALGMVVFKEAISRTTIGTAHYSPFGGDPPGILYHCTREQRDKYLFPVIRGDTYPAMANTESEAGSDAQSIRTRATFDGTHWVINGRKMFSSLADRADFVMVTAVTDPQKRGRGGITMFLVDKGTPGFEVARLVPVIRPQYTTELVLDNVRVPPEQVLGEVGWGFRLFQQWANWGRLMIAAGALGVSDRALEMMMQWARTRVTFGKPLASRQSVQNMIVDSLAELKMARLMTYACAWKYDRGDDVRIETALCKVHCTEMAFRVLDRAIQVLGGLGLTKETPLERWFREIRVLRIGEGANEVLRWYVARQLLDAE
jgi:alkylation response protein AidB-like acyl-CoA dehydrogenase